MKAINCLNGSEYEVLIASDVDENFISGRVIDFHPHWFVLDEIPTKTIRYAFQTYSIEGKYYSGHYTPKHSEVKSISIALDYIKSNFLQIPKEMIKIIEWLPDKYRVEIKNKDISITVGVSFVLSHTEKVDEGDVFNKKYIYSVSGKDWGNSGSVKDLEEIKFNINRDLKLLGIKEEAQMNIFELL